MSDTQSITVLLVDDHAIWRGGVRSMLEDTEFKVVGEASSGAEAVEQARLLHPQIALLDIRMAGGDGLEALVALKKEHPRMVVVMLTTYDNPTYMARAVAGGAAGYLLKGIDFEEMITALRAVAEGELLVDSRTLLRSLRGISEGVAGSADLIEPLTDREEEVLRLVATGLSNKDIASVLFVAESTVKTHVEHILGKLWVSDRVQAAVWAARHGLGPSPE
jgi:DNA-binding NarL/FixJ family response regulator